jgi:ankyrin
VNKPSNDGSTPLYFAIMLCRLAMISKFVQFGADVNKPAVNGVTPLCVAAMLGHSSAVSLLIECGANPRLASTDGSTPLTIARERGHTDIVQLLEASEKTMAGSTPTATVAAGASRKRCLICGIPTISMVCASLCRSPATQAHVQGKMKATE